MGAPSPPAPAPTSGPPSGPPGVEDFLAYNLEIAWVRGPLSFQGEYTGVDLDDGAGDPFFDAWYVQGSYFLTGGDHRGYKKSDGTFDRVKPAAPFDIETGGIGAWEVAARYSTLDLTENPVQGILGPGSLAQVGGEISDLTLAVNWHPNDHTRFSLNYVLSEIEDGVTGRLVRPDADSVAAALAEMLADDELLARLGAAGREHARACSWEANARRVLEIYREVS